MADDKVKLDADQAKAVDINKNSVVSAGAGSGKTRVLAKRFSDIITTCSPPVNRVCGKSPFRFRQPRVKNSGEGSLSGFSQKPPRLPYGNTGAFVR